MPSLRIDVQDEAWPVVIAALAASRGVDPPEAAKARDWVEQIARDLFAQLVHDALTPGGPRPRALGRPRLRRTH